MPHRRWGLLLALLLIASIAQATEPRKITLHSNSEATSANGEQFTTMGYGAVGVQTTIASAWDGTLTYEVTTDGATWTAVNCRNALSTIYASTTVAAAGYVVCPLAGSLGFRARISGRSTGYVTVTAIGMEGTSGLVVVVPSASSTPSASTPVQGPTLFNNSTTGAANTAVTTSIAAVAGARVHLYTVSAYCSAGSATLTIKDGVAGTTIWVSTSGFIGTVPTALTWPVGLTTTTANGMDVVLSTCGGGNTGTLQVQADRF